MKGNTVKLVVAGLLVLSLLAIPLVAACAKPAPAPTPAPTPAPAPAPAPAKERTITLGFLSGFTGPLAVPTKMQFNMCKAYYEWAGESGLIPGIKFDMVTEDTRYDMAQIVPAYMRMQPKKPMIIQFIYSQDGDTIKSLCARDMVPAVGYVTSTLAVDPPEFVFSASPLWDNYEIMVLNWIQDTWDMQKMGRPARYAHLGWDNTMGTCGVEPGKIYAEKLSKVEHVGAEISPPRTMDFSTYVIRLKEVDPDYIWCPLVSGPFASSVKTAVELGMSPGKFIASGATVGQWEAVIAAVGAQELNGTLHAVDQFQYTDNAPGIKLMVDLWKKNYPNDPLPAAASGWSWSIGPMFVIPEAVRIAVQDVGVDRLDSAAIYRALQKIQNFDTKAMAPISFGLNRRDGIRSMKMYEWRDGKDFYLLSDKLYEAKPTAAEVLKEMGK